MQLDAVITFGGVGVRQAIVQFFTLTIFIFGFGQPAFSAPATIEWRGINPARAAGHLHQSHPESFDGVMMSLMIEQSITPGEREESKLYIEGDLVWNQGETSGDIADFSHDFSLSYFPASRTLAFTNFYSLLALFEYEAKNREYIANILAQTGATLPATLGEPFWYESELRVAKTDYAGRLTYIQNRDGLEAYLDDEPVFKLLWMQAEISRDFSSSFWRFARWKFPIHPAIFARIENQGRIPKEIWIKTLPSAAGTTGSEMRVSIANLEPGKWHLPSLLGYSLSETSWQEEAPPGSEKLQLLKNIMGVAATFAPDAKYDFAGEVEKSLALIDEGALLDGALGLLLSFAQGKALCTNQLGDSQFQDACQNASSKIREMVQTGFLSNLGVALDPSTSPQVAIEYLAGMRSKKLEYNFWLGQFMANIYWLNPTVAWNWKTVDNADRDAITLFTKTLDARPAIPSFYKDVGDFIGAGAFNRNGAWILYDIGRSLLPVQLTGDIFTPIYNIEYQLRSKHPEFFKP